MRELVVNTFVSLDGIMQAPGGPEEDQSNGFKFGGWTVNYWDDAMGDFMTDLMGHPFDLVVGRKTYDIFAGYWPTSDDVETAKPLNDASKYVASRGRPNLSWDRSELIEGDVAEGVAKLKQQEGPELQIHGSSDLLQTLNRSNVIDRYRVITFPVILGSGKRLFGEGSMPTGLKMVDNRVSSTGVVMATYEPAGEVPTGSF